jgi:hypothetical protein
MDSINGSNATDGDHEARAARLFSRYSTVKIDRFKKWLGTPHGAKVYELFTGFARQWSEAGHSKCGSALIGNRIRWEMNIGEFNGYKIPNDFLPMLARQLVVDDPAFHGMFSFHGVNAESPAT